MKIKILIVGAILCFSCLPIKAQEKKKIFVCDPPTTEQQYKRWLERDAAYIITNEEKAAYLALQTNEERLIFIENFWLRRDPTPDTETNEFRDEHYTRIAYANENFGAGLHGWKTDRGLIYILFGKPDKVNKGRADFENLKNILFETWFYKRLDGLGSDVEFTFTDPTESDEFRLPKEKREKILKMLGSGLTICYMCPQNSL